VIQGSVLEIKAYGAWNGGTLTDNTIYENKGMLFKGEIPVNLKTIEERIGIRTRMVAPDDVRIGTIAIQNLLDTAKIEPKRIKVVIGATNVGDDKYDPGPLVRYPFKIIKNQCPEAIALDLYAGCPGYNVSVELLFMLTLSGYLKQGDVSVVVGAENIHRAKAFVPLDTSNIIFGDDALATGFETTATCVPRNGQIQTEKSQCSLASDFIPELAQAIFDINGDQKIDGIIIDNQLGKLHFRVPATAARLQHELAVLMFPENFGNRRSNGFKSDLAFYNRRIDAFAYDIMTLSKSPQLVDDCARAYIQSGKFRSIVSVYLRKDLTADISVQRGSGFTFERPRRGIVDTHTRTHGCFADYIQAVPTEDDVFGDMNGKGVFLYATRGAKEHLSDLMQQNQLSVYDLDLLIEHQANFAMIPMMLEKVLDNGQPGLKKEVVDYLSNKMITNIHTRGNCSVVCMQRLPYDLEGKKLTADNIQGFRINQNLAKLRSAKVILNDSVGAGMTRSSFPQIKK